MSNVTPKISEVMGSLTKKTPPKIRHVPKKRQYFNRKIHLPTIDFQGTCYIGFRGFRGGVGGLGGPLCTNKSIQSTALGHCMWQLWQLGSRRPATSKETRGIDLGPCFTGGQPVEIHFEKDLNFGI